MASAILPIVTIALQAEPEFAAMIRAALALRKKYPALSPDQIASAVQAATGESNPIFDSELARIAADQGKPAA